MKKIFPIALILIMLVSCGGEVSKNQQTTEPITQTVYVTKTGTKYHTANCRFLSKSKIPMNLEDAKKSYTPCSVCNPPQ